MIPPHDTPPLAAPDIAAVAEGFREAASPALEERLRAARRMLARHIIGRAPVDLMRFWRGAEGSAYRAVIDAEPFLLMPEGGDGEDGDRDLACRAAVLARTADTRLQFAQGVLAGLLFRHPDALPVSRLIERTPGWLQDWMARQAVRRPTFFTEEDGAARHVRFQTALFGEVLRLIAAGHPPDGPMTGTVIRSHALHAMLASDCVTRPAMRARAKVIAAHTAPLCPAFCPPEGVAPAAPGRRMRIGILSAHFDDRPNTYYVWAHFEKLDPARFEVVLFSTREAENRAFEAEVVASADRHVSLAGLPLDGQVAAIRAEGCDALLFAGNAVVALDPLAMLGNYRLARHQIALGASPSTTGLAEMDWFLSAPGTEGTDAAAHYTERLLMLDRVFCCFHPRFGAEEPGYALTRADLGAQDGTPVFVSNANLTKITPRVLRVWAGIMRRVPGSLLVLAPFNPFWVEKSAQRYGFSAHARHVLAAEGVSGNRLRLIDTLPGPADIRHLVAQGDVYLDSFPFSGCTSLIDPLRAGRPVVVRRGRTQRARQAGAMLRSLGLDELVADSEAQYVEIAVGLAEDLAGTRERYAARIAGRLASAPFLDTIGFARELGAVLEGLDGR